MLFMEIYFKYTGYLKQLYSILLGTITQSYVHLITLNVLLEKPCTVPPQLHHLRNAGLVMRVPEILSPLTFFGRNLTFHILVCIKLYSFHNQQLHFVLKEIWVPGHPSVCFEVITLYNGELDRHRVLSWLWHLLTASCHTSVSHFSYL